MKPVMWSIVALLVCGGVVSTAAYAVEKGRATAPIVVPQHQQTPKAQQQADPEAQKQAMMEKMREAGSPGEGHKPFKTLAGTWTYEGEWRMSPESAPESMKGVANNSLVYGGRFLKQEISGPPMAEGMPEFQGLGFTGHNNMTGEYETVWMDNMGTGMMRGKGKFDAASSTLTDEGTFSCPMTGETDRWYRTEWQIKDPNHTVYRSYSKAPDGNEFKGMEIRYTRMQPE